MLVFVLVMSEEYKKLVACVEDFGSCNKRLVTRGLLHEDMRTNKMAAVRRFHSVDEVGIVLHSNINDKFSMSSRS